MYRADLGLRKTDTVVRFSWYSPETSRKPRYHPPDSRHTTVGLRAGHGDSTAVFYGWMEFPDSPIRWWPYLPLPWWNL